MENLKERETKMLHLGYTKTVKVKTDPCWKGETEETQGIREI